MGCGDPKQCRGRATMPDGEAALGARRSTPLDYCQRRKRMAIAVVSGWGLGERSVHSAQDGGIHVELDLIRVRSITAIKSALLTIRPPIRKGSCWHLLVSQVGLHSNKSTPVHCPHSPNLYFLSLNRTSILNLRCQCEMKAGCHRRSTTVNPSLATT
jgi:hypothetical protein